MAHRGVVTGVRGEPRRWLRLPRLSCRLRNEYHLFIDRGQPVTDTGTTEFTLAPQFQGPYATNDTRMRAINGNLFIQAFLHARRRLSQAADVEVTRYPCFIDQRVDIPPVRGLGSSSSACVAGTLAATEFMKLTSPELSTSELLAKVGGGTGRDKQRADTIATLAMEVGSNPDNLCAALAGGLTQCYCDERPVDVRSSSIGRVHLFRDELEDESLRCVALVPASPLPTPRAREILETQRYELDDVVFNLQRATCLPRVLRAGRYELLSEITKDRVHQSQRAHHFFKTVFERPINVTYVFDAATANGAYCAFISGAGSTLVALADVSLAGEVAESLERAFREVAEGWEVDDVMMLRPTNEGAVCWSQRVSGAPELKRLERWTQGLSNTQARPQFGFR